jgi:hypothetical protein
MVEADVPLEQAALAQKASDRERTHIFARYSLSAATEGFARESASGIKELWHDRGVTVSTSASRIVLHISRKCAMSLPSRPGEPRSRPQHPAGQDLT